MYIGKQAQGNRWTVADVSIRAKESLEDLGGSVTPVLGGKWLATFPEETITVGVHRDQVRIIIEETIFSLCCLPGKRRRSAQRVVLIHETENINNPAIIGWVPKQIIMCTGEDTDDDEG